MCNFASFVLTKDSVFYLDDSDSHSEIIAKHDLHESGTRGVNVLKVEIRPSNKIKIWPSLKLWDYVIDQDIMPQWFDADADEKRARNSAEKIWRAGVL